MKYVESLIIHNVRHQCHLWGVIRKIINSWRSPGFCLWCHL